MDIKTRRKRAWSRHGSKDIMKDERILKAMELMKVAERDEELTQLKKKIMEKIVGYFYSYNFTWLGRPIIQIPQDIIAVQEIIWKVKPDFVIETGVAHGGGVIFYASILELIGGEGKVIGIDVDIRKHNFREILQHPISKRVILLEGDSVDIRLVEKIYELCRGKNNIVILDSLHTREHVLKELELYSSLVKKGGYIIVFDTIIEDLPEGMYPDRPWGKGNNPKIAVVEFLEKNKRFVVDKEIERKLWFTVAPSGYLKCIR